MQSLVCDLWLLERNAMRQFMAHSLSGVRLDPEMVKASIAAPTREKAIGILPIHGILEARTTFLGQMLGMTSYESIQRGFDSLLNDDSVSSIVMDFMTPGGMAYLCQETANKIYQARGRKPIISVINPLAASGGIWLASAADRIVITPSGDTGSVGVISEHVDISKALETNGQTVTTIRSTNAPFKGEQTDSEPLSAEAKANLQARADAIHTQFAGDLAKFRGVSVEHVNERFGKGRVVNAEVALANKMVDRIDTLQGVITKLASGRIRIASTAVQDDWNAPTVRELMSARAAHLRTIGSTEGAA